MTLVQSFFCEFCKIFGNIFITEHLPPLTFNKIFSNCSYSCKAIIFCNFVSFSKLTKTHFKYKIRSGLERHIFTLASPHRHHTKNTGVIRWTPETLYGELFYLFLIHSFSTLLITIFTISLVKSTIFHFSFTAVLSYSYFFSCTSYLSNKLRQS